VFQVYDGKINIFKRKSKIPLLQKNALGQDLLDKVFEQLELVEKDFFGLQFVGVFETDSEKCKVGIIYSRLPVYLRSAILIIQFEETSDWIRQGGCLKRRT
jgi:hypothetical protein